MKTEGGENLRNQSFSFACVATISHMYLLTKVFRDLLWVRVNSAEDSKKREDREQKSSGCDEQKCQETKAVKVPFPTPFATEIATEV